MKKIFTIVCIIILFGCSDTPGVKNEVIESPINLSHALSLVDSMVVEDEMIAYIWIYSNAPDMSSDLIISLTELHNTGKFNYYDVIEKIALGLINYQYQNTGHDLDGMLLYWNNTWHNWGKNQTFALLEAYKVIGDSTFLANITCEKKYELTAENIFAWFIGQNKTGFSYV